MKAPSTRLSSATIAIVALIAAPATAATVEEGVVPPSNSAAAQYTETFPTTGGDKKTDRKPNHRSPSKVLGSHNAKRLEEQGPEGRAAAETAAATAPTSLAAPTAQTPAGSNDEDGKGQGGGGKGAGQPEHKVGGDTGTAQPQTPEPAGSSGIGSAIGQATGLSAAGQGPLLPLAIVITAIWALAYAWRQRRPVE